MKLIKSWKEKKGRTAPTVLLELGGSVTSSGAKKGLPSAGDEEARVDADKGLLM